MRRHKRAEKQASYTCKYIVHLAMKRNRRFENSDNLKMFCDHVYMPRSLSLKRKQSCYTCISWPRSLSHEATQAR